MPTDNRSREGSLSEDDRSQAPRGGSTKPGTPFHPDLTWREELVGHKPGDKVVRIARHRYFRGTAPDVLQARPEATEPRAGLGRLWFLLKRFLIGTPIPSIRESEERLSKVKALAVLSSDALSSVAYATEAAMRVLIVAGAAALAFTLPISLAVVTLLAIVAMSYMQTIRAYPSGGGSYVVAKENLGEFPGVAAAGALLVGYILTVAVSIAAGIDALISAFPDLKPLDMHLTLGSVALITIMNLRGVRESGTVFAAPTYVFVFSIFGMIAFGIARLLTGGIPYTPGEPGPQAGIEPLTWFLVLSAFAKGASAMTGTEAIANSVPAFQAPEPRNARITLGMMAALLGGMFLGISFLVTRIGIVPSPDESQTVLAELTRTVVGGENWYFFLVQFATTLILLLAANTSYTGFPWLLSVMARDRYAPRWFGGRGDRLVFSVGIMALTITSAALLLGFGSSVDRLLPLYALGVFAAFTLSQAGMVIHWLRERGRGWQRSAVINGVGAATTGIATVVVGVTRFAEGAWMVMVVVPILMALFLAVNRHYRAVSKQLRTKTIIRPRGVPPLVVVPIPNLNLVTRQALAFAQDLSKRVVAVHVTSDMKEAEVIRGQWDEVVGEVPLVIVESPYRMLLPPLLAYVDALRETHPNDMLVVVLPEFVTKHWWENILHNQTALRLKAALLYRPGVSVTSFPYQLAE